MATVEERREVARRLRELDYSDLQESLICAYLDALGIKGYEDWIGIAHRLADLIEPSFVHGIATAVRCRDCASIKHTTDGRRYCTRWSHIVPLDGYCWRGEAKNGEEAQEV